MAELCCLCTFERQNMEYLEKLVKFFILTLVVLLICDVPIYFAARNTQNPVIEDIIDIKDFKKLIRTKNNVLVCFVNSLKQSSNVVKVFKETSLAVKGEGTMVLIDCSGDAKKLCKKLKVTPETYILKHYKDGEYHKDYDRKESVFSMLNFMRDPTGDIPWEEEPTGASVYHIPDATSLTKFLRREYASAMVMFYAPWCGFCKQMKPEYSAAASELKGHSILAAIDVNRPENAAVRIQHNITGFPTLVYYEHGVRKLIYEGESKKDSIVSFMKNPSLPPVKTQEQDWSLSENEIQFLTSSTFEKTLSLSDSLLIMFYAPWCGHCQRLKPEYEKAAERLKSERISGVLAAIDATKEPSIAQKFNINGYPTLKYFRNGEFKFDVNIRDEENIVKFMKDPKAPPPPPAPEKPWSEEETDVVHLTEDSFKPFLRKKKHVLVFFYAPWCLHCKNAKPEFTKASEKFRDDPKIEFAAVDCTKHTAICESYEVSGYPTLKYFHYLNKEPPKHYSGGRKRDDFVSYMKVFSESTVKEDVKVESQSATDGSDFNSLEGGNLVISVSSGSFDSVINEHESILVLFRTTWCGACNKMKKAYAAAALILEQEQVPGKLAELDATKDQEIAIEHDIVGFPTMKYFYKGKFMTLYTGQRTADDIANFMRNPPTVPEVETKKDEL